jgi:hypothetical protein
MHTKKTTERQEHFCERANAGGSMQQFRQISAILRRREKTALSKHAKTR